MMIYSGSVMKLLFPSLHSPSTQFESYITGQQDPWSKDLTSGIRAIWRTLLKKTLFLHTRLTFSVSMDSLSPQVVSAAKLPILNPTEFDLWKKRIEQYFLMTDNSLWKVILNARKNELKACSTLLMDFPDKHLLKFNSHKDAKTLMEAIEKRFGGNAETKKVQKTLLKQQYENFTGSSSQSLDQIHDRLQKLVSHLEIHRVSFSQKNVNLNTTELVSAAASVSVVCAKMPVSSLTNADSLSNAVIYSFFASQSYSPQLDNEDLKKGHFEMECRSPKDSTKNGAAEPQRRNVPRRSLPIMLLWPSYLQVLLLIMRSQFDVISYQTCLESVEARLLVYKQNESVFEEDIKLLKLEVRLRDNALVTLRQKLEKVKQEKDDLKLKFQPSDGYHAIPLPCTGTFMPPKPDLVFYTAPTAVKTDHSAFNVFNSEDESKTKASQIVPSFIQSTEQVKSPRHSVQHVENSIPAATPKSSSPKPTILTRSKPVPITTVRPVSTAMPKLKGNPQHALNDKGVIDSGCSRHMTGNLSYLSDFKELNGGYVAFGGNPKGGKISGKGKIRTGKLDFDDVYFVKELKFNLFSISQMCDKKNSVLFTDTECLVLSPDFKLPDESQVLLRVPRENNMLGHINFKTMNKLVNGNLVRGLPTKVFENDNISVACKKGKQHRASCKTKPVSSVDQPLYRLHMDLFGPTFVKSLNKNSYCLVVTYDYSRFTWVFFFATKDETSPILKTFITGLENQLSLKVKVIRSDNGTEFKNHDLNQTLIEAARTMLADSLLPIPFWAEAVNTACYVHNKVLVTKPHNKTPYELLHGRTPSIGFMRPFGYLVTIFNTLDSLGKFERKANEGFLVGYSVNSKSFRVVNSRTRIVQETLHVNFIENKPNVAGSGSTWLFDIDSLTRTMTYQPVTVKNQSNPSAGFQDKFDAEKAGGKSDQQYVLFPVWSSGSTNPHNTDGDDAFDEKKPESEVNVSLSSSAQSRKQDDKTKKEAKGKSHPNTWKFSFIDAFQLLDDPDMPELEDITYSDDEDDVATQTKSMTRVAKDQGGLSQMFNDDFHTCMFACFFSQEELKRVHQAFKDLSWIEAMQEELLQFRMQKVWILVYLPHGKRAIGTKWVFRNKKDEKGIVIRNKARLITQAHTQEEGIDYEEVFAPVARIEAIRLFLAYASFMGFMVYQMDVKSAFLYRTIEKEVYVCQPLGFEDPNHPDKVYKVVKALYGLHQALRAWYETLANYLLENSFQRGKIDQTLFIKRQKCDIMLVQIYVDGIILSATNKDLCKSFEKLKRIFRYLKGKPHLGLWYPKDSPFDLVAYSGSVYAGASLDRKSTTGGCQFLGCRLISWQCKKQTVVATSSTEVYITAASTNIIAVEAQVPAATLTVASTRVTATPSRRRKGVVIRDLQEESTTSTIIPAETKSEDKAIDHVKKNAKEDPAVQRYHLLNRKPHTEAQARKNMMVYLKNVAGFKMDYFKGMSYDDIRPIFEAKFNTNVAFLLNTKEQIEEDENKALKRLNETPTEKEAKRQKLDEEVEELKRHLQIVPNKDDDVYTEATPLARKVPVVDYQIFELNNKPYYKIIRADDTHPLYIITFTTTQLILLVERKYPLTRFTLNQMLNVVRLEVEEVKEILKKDKIGSKRDKNGKGGEAGKSLKQLQ
nr:hypothetical protein [Tanacetum cinerariifolium]